MNLSTTFHPKRDGQAECTIQILEKMLRVCNIDFKSNFDDYLPLIKFSSNNSYNKLSACQLLKNFMGGGVDPHLGGMMLYLFVAWSMNLSRRFGLKKLD